MALRATMTMAAAPRGLMRMFCTNPVSSFVPPPLSGSTPGREMAPPSTNLFVSGLSKRTTTEGLHKAFSEFGTVVNAKVVTDRMSGYSKGFGFVEYANLDDAAKGIVGMDGKFLDGWVIFAEYAKPKPPPQNNMGAYGNNFVGQRNY